MSQFDITVADAQTKTQNFQTLNGGTNKAVSIPKNEVLELLNQANCTGLRIYFALSSQGSPASLSVVLVATQDNGTGDFHQALDIIPTVSSPAKLKDNAVPCPPGCNAYF